MPGDAADWLRAWDSQGFHRTGTEADLAGAAWLVGEAVALWRYGGRQAVRT